jgi:hypothetical protein
MTETMIPYTHEIAVQENIQRIRQAKHEGPDNVTGSTSQMIMIALALCDPEFLPRGYKDCEPEDRWRRLDDVQREAVVSWWSE